MIYIPSFRMMNGISRTPSLVFRSVLSLAPRICEPSVDLLLYPNKNFWDQGGLRWAVAYIYSELRVIK